MSTNSHPHSLAVCRMWCAPAALLCVCQRVMWVHVCMHRWARRRTVACHGAARGANLTALFLLPSMAPKISSFLRVHFLIHALTYPQHRRDGSTWHHKHLGKRSKKTGCYFEWRWEAVANSTLSQTTTYHESLVDKEDVSTVFSRCSWRVVSCSLVRHLSVLSLPSLIDRPLGSTKVLTLRKQLLASFIQLQSLYCFIPVESKHFDFGYIDSCRPSVPR